ncbi:MAG TPA: VOC family protein [Opitutaceae bacterium]|nr:VOC family protein [Opitutaceae bacterium]
MSTALVQPYLNFEGRCEEALRFYERAVGAKTESLYRFKDAPPVPGGGRPPGPPDKVMHASFRVGDAVLMASDCECGGRPAFAGISLAYTVKDDAAAERAFQALAEQGEVRQPLAATFFASRFGVVVDRFGVCWMILASPRSP